MMSDNNNYLRENQSSVRRLAMLAPFCCGLENLYLFFHTKPDIVSPPRREVHLLTARHLLRCQIDWNPPFCLWLVSRGGMGQSERWLVDRLKLVLMLISLPFALRHKHKKNEPCSFFLCLCLCLCRGCSHLLLRVLLLMFMFVLMGKWKPTFTRDISHAHVLYS